MKQPTDIPVEVVIVIVDQGDMLEVFFGDSNGGRMSSPPSASMTIRRHPTNHYGVVCYSEATSGWGPVLYRAAIVAATGAFGGLAPDRGQVSEDAATIWERLYYYSADTENRVFLTAEGETLHGLDCLDAVYSARSELYAQYAPHFLMF